MAKRLALPLLQQLECLSIRDQEQAERLLRELEVVRGALQDPDKVSVSQEDAVYMLQRISEVEPLIRGAVKEWGRVDHLSL